MAVLSEYLLGLLAMRRSDLAPTW
ncbi:hypothetical protein CCACVL1_20149 [Corchorus capsularis]|uniref:Uncharacterized protein n=1 Tax=Corchorus capsularis TaxID=210143 RepID=A0A1R3HCD1_COCAP|nr:hypothetical protein CCACVL1_20149 [Corchorus capsularis]